MNWLEMRIKHPGKILALLLVFMLGMQYAPQSDPICNETLKEIRPMSEQVIVNYGDYEVIMPPCTYCAGDYIRYVFAVPKDNTVGTNELDNAITLLRFKSDNELEKKMVKKDFMEMVTGPFEFRFLPVWSEKEVAYSQSQGFLIVNLAEKKINDYEICPGLNDQIENLSVVDAKLRVFVFEINKPYAKVQGFKKILRTIRFENDTFAVHGEKPAGLRTGYSEPWFVYQNKIFVYSDSTTTIDAYDEQLKPASHPLAEAFNQSNGTFRRMLSIAIHPSLPIALIVEKGKDLDVSKFDSLPTAARNAAIMPLYRANAIRTLYLFRWTHPDPKQRFIPLLSPAGSIWNSYDPAGSFSDFTFSPDGKWVVFRDNSNDPNNPVFVAVPIDPKNPLYLGKPIKLGNAMRKGSTGPESTAWTTNPTAFVMCDGLAIYRNLDAVLSMRKENVPPGTAAPF